MAKSYHLNVMVDPELFHALDKHSKASGMNRSEATRHLLRHALTASGMPENSKLTEAYSKAISAVKRVVADAIHSIPVPE